MSRHRISEPDRAPFILSFNYTLLCAVSFQRYIPPKSGAELFAAKDETARPRWRTADDIVPFTGARSAWLFGIQPLRPESATADPCDIASLVNSIVSFVRESDLPPELVACGVEFPMLFTHPFVDGNGHTTRLLTCDLLHKAGYSVASLLALIDCLHEVRPQVSQMVKGVVMRDASSEEFVAFYMGRLLAAQERVRAFA